MTSSSDSSSSYGPVMTTELVVEERHALVQQALNLRHPLAVLKRLIQVPHGHLEIQPSLRADAVGPAQAAASLSHLLPQHLLVDRHDQHVVEVEFHSRVHEHPDNVGEVIQLVLAEELVVQIEGTKHHVHHGHVVLIAAMERVVAHGYVRPGGVENAQIARRPAR